MGKTLVPESFEITEAMRNWARIRFPTLDIDAQTEEFVDYWKAHGRKMADWGATWRNWMRRCPQFAPKTAPATKWRGLTAKPPAPKMDQAAEEAYQRRMQAANEDCARRYGVKR